MTDHESTTHQPRWPAGTPIAPGGHGPGGGRWRPGPGGIFGAAVGMAAERLDRMLSSGRKYQVRNVFGEWVDAVGYHDDENGRHLQIRDHLGNTADMDRTTYMVREKLGEGRSVSDWAHQVSSRLSGSHPLTASMMSHEQVASYLGRTDYTVIGDAGGAYGEVEFRRYSDGRVLAHKLIRPGYDAEAEIDNEVQASIIARALGAPVPAVVQDTNDPRGMLMEYIDEPTMDHQQRRDAYAHGGEHTPDGRMIGLLDTLIANSDRHDSNVRFPSSGRVVGVDQGGAFKKKWFVVASPSPAVLVSLGKYSSKLFRVENGQYIQWYYSREAIEEARRRIETVKDELDPKIWAGIDESLTVLYHMSGAGTWLDS